MWCPWCLGLFDIHRPPVGTAVALSVPRLPWQRCPELSGQDVPLPHIYFQGLAPAKQTPLGLAGPGLFRGTLCSPSTPSPSAQGPSRCFAQRLTTNQQATPAPDQCVLLLGLKALQGRKASRGVNGSGRQLFTPTSFPVHGEEPLLALAHPPTFFGGDVPPESNIHHQSWHMPANNLCACELASASSVQQCYRKIKSQTNGTISFWTMVFSLDTDDVNSVRSDILLRWLAHAIFASHILFLLLEKTRNHSALMVLGTASRKAN